MTLQDTGNFRRRLAAFLDPTNPNLDQIEPYPSDMGGEVKPPIFSTMPYFGGGSMEPIGPYIPSEDNQGIELLAKGKSVFSTPALDRQQEINKYFDNIRRLKERGLLYRPSLKNEVLFAGFL